MQYYVMSDSFDVLESFVYYKLQFFCTYVEWDAVRFYKWSVYK